MKRFIIPSVLAAACALAACDVLDTSPKDTLSPSDYFRTETDLQLFSNTFYNNLLDKQPFDEQSDIIVNYNLDSRLRGGTNRVVPATGGGWTWTDLRKMNTLLEYIGNCPDESAVKEYTGVTRFFRAFFYFEKVKRFGDVPWIDRQLGSAEDDLYNPRDSRETIMTHMLEDIDYAIDNLPSEKRLYRVSKWSALALKAQFCLYEGTFRKYHGISLEGHTWQDWLTLAADAAKQIMDSKQYKLADDFVQLFAEIDADPDEYILAIKNDMSLSITNNCSAYARMPTQGRPGLTKKFVDSFLMKDGSRFTDKSGWNTMTFVDEVKDRDPRLSYTIVTPGYHRLGSTEELYPDLGSSVTGFQMAKFVMALDTPYGEKVDRVSMSYNDMPVYRLGEVYLIYAEALAELGTITQDDLDASVNLLRQRVGMPDMSLADANANPDPYLTSDEYGYHNVPDGANKGVILEIRRERTVELAFEGRRWDDLMRWKEGVCISQTFHGMYFPSLGEYDLTGDGVADILLTDNEAAAKAATKVAGIYVDGVAIKLSDGDRGYLDVHKDIAHVFDESRDYYYPIPSKERQLNPNLTQNPNWDDGLDF